MKKILVPIDFSEESLNALESARSFAENAGSSIVLLHVIEDPNILSTRITGEMGYDPMTNVYIRQLKDKTQEKLGELVSDKKFEKIDISYKIDIDNAYSAIVNNIVSEQASLIIMGSKGASGLKEILVGSVADKVTRHATCPVIVVKGEAQFSYLNDIVFATDLDEDQDEVLEKLKEYQTFFNSHLHVFNAVTSDKTYFAEVQQKMQALMERHNMEDYSLIVERNDDIADAILEFAKKKNAGLIAFSSHDRHGLLRLVESKVSKNLTNHAHRPVWTVAVN